MARNPNLPRHVAVYPTQAAPPPCHPFADQYVSAVFAETEAQARARRFNAETARLAREIVPALAATPVIRRVRAKVDPSGVKATTPFNGGIHERDRERFKPDAQQPKARAR